MNAISLNACGASPTRSAPGSAVVDGAVFGQPPGQGRATRLYLAGADSPVELVASLFTDSALHVCRVGGHTRFRFRAEDGLCQLPEAARTLAASLTRSPTPMESVISSRPKPRS